MALRKKRHRRKARARSATPRSNPRRRRRRSNPVPVLFANPRHHKPRRRKARRVSIVVANPRRRRRKTNPHRARRKHRRLSNPGRRRYARLHRRRRSNPGRLNLGSLKGFAKIALAGGLGIVTARMGGYLYTKYLSGTVSGGQTTGIRATISDVARLASMGILTVAVDKGLAQTKVCGPQTCQAFKIGGFAETGRQAVGLLVKQLSPATDRSRYGLDGNLGALETRYGFMGDLEDSESFMGDLEEASSFEGWEENEYETSSEHPFALAG